MKRVGSLKGIAFSGTVTELTSHMTSTPSNVAQEEVTPSSSEPRATGSKSKRTRDPKPTSHKVQRTKKQTDEAPLPQMSQSERNENEVVNEEQRDHMGRAATTVTTSEGVQDSGNITRTQPMATQDTEIPLDSSIAEDPVDINVSSGPRCQETTLGGDDVQTRSETLLKRSYDPSKEVNTSGDGEDSSLLNELMVTCTNLCEQVKMLKDGFKQQQKQISKLKGTVKILLKEKKSRKTKAQSRSEGLKRLVKAGRAQVVMSTSSSSSFSADDDIQMGDHFLFTGAAGSAGITRKQADALLAEEEEPIENETEFVHSPVSSNPEQSKEVEKEPSPILGSGLFEDVPPEVVASKIEKVVKDALDLNESADADNDHISSYSANDELLAAEALIDVAKVQTPPKTVTPRSLGVTINESETERIAPKDVKDSEKGDDEGKRKDKGKKILVEPEKPLKRKELEAFSEMEAKRIEDEWNAGLYDEDEDRIKVDMGDGVSAMMSKEEQIHFDELYAKRKYEVQWMKSTPEERQIELEDLLRKRRQQESAKSYAKLKAKPKTKAQLKDMYTRRVRSYTGLTLSALKKWSFEALKERCDAEDKVAKERERSREIEAKKDEVKQKPDENLVTFSRKRKRSNTGAGDEERKRQKKDDSTAGNKNVSTAGNEDVSTAEDVGVSTAETDKITIDDEKVDSTAEKEGISTASDNVVEDTYEAMIVIDNEDYTPLTVHYPIIDWHIYTDSKMKSWIKVIRGGSDQNEELYPSFYRICYSLSRNDLDDIWVIAMRKYLNAERHSHEKIIYDSLAVMYEQNSELEYFTKVVSNVKSWYCFAHNGVHMIIHEDGATGYFFVGTEYPWSLKTLKQLMRTAIHCRDQEIANELGKEIKGYLVKKMKEFTDNISKESEDKMRKKFEEAFKKGDQ